MKLIISHKMKGERKWLQKVASLNLKLFSEIYMSLKSFQLEEMNVFCASKVWLSRLILLTAINVDVAKTKTKTDSKRMINNSQETVRVSNADEDGIIGIDEKLLG